MVEGLARQPIHYAALEDDLEALKVILAEGADPDTRDSAGMTALHFAAQERSLSVARLLLEHGASVDAEDEHGNTPLAKAVFYSRGEGDMIGLLREHGADPLKPNTHGQTPFGLAQLIANYPVAQWFSDLSERSN